MFADEIVSALAEGRALAEDLMLDLCTVREPPTSSTMDQTTGEIIETPGALVYSGKFKIQDADNMDRESEAGGHQFVTARWRLHFPSSAPPIVEDHRVVCTAAAVTPQNVGRRFRVAAPGVKSLGTSQKVPAEELVGRSL